MGRTSSITNALVNGVIPVIIPSDEEIKEVLEIFDLDVHNVLCVYCGNPFTEWDHLRPLIKDKMPTGFISEIQNLVPACGKCNQSKGNKNWEEWILSDAKLSPKTRQIKNLEKRIAQLKAFENWKPLTIINFNDEHVKQAWKEYNNAYHDILEKMAKCNTLAPKVKEKIQNQVSRK